MPGLTQLKAPKIISEGFWQEQMVQQWQSRFAIGGLTGLYLSIGVTLNPADKNATVTLSADKLTATASSSTSWQGVRATAARPGTGAYQFSVLLPSVPNDVFIGFGNSSASLANYVGSDANSWGYLSIGSIYAAGVGTGVAVSYTSDVITCIYDGAKITWLRNGALIGTATASGVLYPMVSLRNSATTTADFTSLIVPAFPASSWDNASPFVMLDTLNPYDIGDSAPTLSNGNLTETGNASGLWAIARAYRTRSAGKFYFEGTVVSGSGVIFGVSNTAETAYPGASVNGVGLYTYTGSIYDKGAAGVGYAGAFVAGDVCGVAVDFSLGKMWFSKNGVFPSGNPVAGTGGATLPSGTLYPTASLNATTDIATMNFGASYTLLPAGYAAWDGSAQQAIPNTLNPNDRGTHTLSNGNLTATGPASAAWTAARPYLTRSSGKYYFELSADAGALTFIGISNRSETGLPGTTANGVGHYFSNGNIYDKGAAAAGSAVTGYVVGDRAGCAVDFTLGMVWFYKNGISAGGDAVAGTGGWTLPSGALYPTVSINSSASSATINLGASACAAAPPTGFLMWNGSTPVAPIAAWSASDRPNSNWPVAYQNGLAVSFNGTSASGTTRGNTGVSSGKRYVEHQITNAAIGTGGIGIATSTVPLTGSQPGNDPGGYNYTASGAIFNNGAALSGFSGGTPLVCNDGVSLAIDYDNRKFYVAVNGVWQFGANPSAGTGGATFAAGTYFPAWGNNGASTQLYSNFGGAPTTFAAPTGYTMHDGSTPTLAASAFDQTRKSVNHQLLYSSGYNRIAYRSSGSSTWESAVAKTSASSGKRYFEAKVAGTVSGSNFVGLAKTAFVYASNAVGLDGAGNSVGLYSPANAGVYYAGSAVAAATYPTWVTGDIIGVYYDFTLGKVWFSRNGVVLSGDPVAGTGGYSFGTGFSLCPAISTYTAGDQYQINTGGYALQASMASGAVAAGWAMWDGSTPTLPAYPYSGETTQSLPFMTSDTAPSGHTVTYSSAYGAGYEGYLQYDSSTTTTSWSALGGTAGFPHWISRNTPTAIRIWQYEFYQRTAYSGPTGSNFVFDWKFQGSNDGFHWTDLDKVTGCSTNITARTIPVAARGAYKMHRLFLVRGNGDCGGMNLKMLQEFAITAT